MGKLYGVFAGYDIKFNKHIYQIVNTGVHVGNIMMKTLLWNQKLTLLFSQKLNDLLILFFQVYKCQNVKSNQEKLLYYLIMEIKTVKH